MLENIHIALIRVFATTFIHSNSEFNFQIQILDEDTVKLCFIMTLYGIQSFQNQNLILSSKILNIFCSQLFLFSGKLPYT